MLSIPLVEPISDEHDVQFLNAAKSGDVQIVKNYIESGVDLDEADANGNTALMLASMAGHLKVVNILLEAGADFRRKSDKGWDAYHCAMLFGDMKGITMSPHKEIMAAIATFGYLLRQ